MYVCIVRMYVYLYIFVCIYVCMSPEHAMSTTLEAVGLQVWRGALLMADYLLHSQRLHCSVVLELGAGTGLVSSIAALKAHHVFCTGQLQGNSIDLLM